VPRSLIFIVDFSTSTMGKFDNKVVVITGSGQGIGRCLALTYAKEGAHVGK
jgi:hypothetical protein